MSNPSKARGTRWESEIVDYLCEHGFPHAERRALHGSVDLGDLTGIPGYVVEAKALKVAEFGVGLTQAIREAENADRHRAGLVTAPHVPILMAKRRQHGVAGGYFVTTIAHGVELMRESEWCPHPSHGEQ